MWNRGDSGIVMQWRRFLPLPFYVAAAIFCGCAVQGAPFEKAYAPPAHAAIYVYRPYSYAGSLLRPAVTCGDDTTRIGPGGYHAFIEPVGDIICRVQGGESADEVELLATPRVYYIRERIGWGLMTGHPQLDPIDTDKAQTEIQRCCVAPR
ncbi:MAG: hypothetical protein ACREQ4_18060 [Candidatus Binataceae bacterium]